MLFNSVPFLLLFLPAAVLAVASVGERPRARRLALLAVSLAFYGSWDPRFLVVLLGGIGLNWLVARRVAADRGSALYWAAVAADLALLGACKYADFVAGSFGVFDGMGVATLGLPVPLGISFFTFHHIMYLTDLRRRRAPLAPLDGYALYIAFFPQAVAGPLARWSEVGAQFGRSPFAPGWEERWATGIVFILFGLVQKVALGDPLGRLLDPVYAAAASGPVADGQAWLAIGFVLQVFFDFAGYTDIAIGLGLLFGVQLPANFNAPFRACSILELWGRWHMTLGRFLRDYVFLPLADLRIAGTRHSVPQYVAAILLTMGLCGLWHGAGWTFVLWGVLQGAAMVAALGWRRGLGRPPRAVGWVATILFFALTGVLFRAPSLAAAANLYTGLLDLPGLATARHAWPIAAAFAAAVLLPASHVLCPRIARVQSRAVAVGLGVAGLLLLVQMGGSESYEFIYFKF